VKKKLAIIGASYLQRPLVAKAKEMGLETHVFAWEKGNVVSDIATKFYPISITEKDEILKICKKLKIDGIVSIASDLAITTVNYIAVKLNLIGNPLDVNYRLTDKFEMRRCLLKNGIKCPKFELYNKPEFKNDNNLKFPVIIKPTDRSGSRGVTKVDNPEDVNDAIKYALNQSINKRVIVEEFIKGNEYSVETLSFKGMHQNLVITEKETTGPPNFVEASHHQPADIDKVTKHKIFEIVEDALNALNLVNGASHTEILISNDVFIVEIGGRMGGDFIGSNLVLLSTGYDFVKETIKVALGIKPTEFSNNLKKYAGIYYYTPKTTWVYDIIKNEGKKVVESKFLSEPKHRINNSADRFGYFIYQDNKKYKNSY